MGRPEIKATTDATTQAFATPHATGRVVTAASADLASLWEVDDPDQWQQLWPDLTEVKASTVRTVYRMQVGERDVHVKLFRPVRLSDRARDSLGGPRAGREFDQLQRARARGLPAVEPLAAGTFRGSLGSRSFLVTATAAEAQPLPPQPWPAALAAEIGKLLRRAHDAGLHAPDLHRGNMLTTPRPAAGEAPPDLWLLDLTGAHVAQPVEDRDRAKALAFFFQHLDGGAADPGVRACWRAYAAPEELHSPRFVDLYQRALRASRRVRYRALLAFGRRSFRPCRHTTTQDARPHTGRAGRLYLHRPAPQKLQDAALSLLIDPTTATTIKEGRRGGVYAAELLIAKTRTAAHARKLFRGAYWLTFAGVPTPQPVVLLTEAKKGERRGLVVTERLPGPDLQAEWTNGALTDGDLIDAARSLGTGIGRLHAHGLRHRDLKWDNLVRHGGEVHIVDLDGLRRKLPSDTRGVGADLGRLHAAWRAAGEPGGTTLLRAFLHSYLRARHRLLAPRLTRHDLRTAAVRSRAWSTAHGAPH